MKTHPMQPADKPPIFSMSIAGTLLAAREAVMADLRPHLKKNDFTEAQWRVLRAVAEGNCNDQRSVARAALLHPPSVTRILKELAQRGLVERGANETDGRRQIIVATARAREILDEATETNREIVRRYRATFGAERFDRMVSELRDFTATVRSLGADRQDDDIA
ncbi:MULTISPECIES: MarR family transcriptional regulator [Sphingomonadales]|uniref:Transcriptional regulator, MarR family n=1 Tax=Rhizorhabdus wittichii (strain DSM 6014 / CCUG 31198 / JCM 15750 / NBRC 105917 / EY 4224 / RW1) TaxID=392499 RepID=A0A9J9LDQ7_RHIWR|nr:transcriptional regulator, MarR family [Rhizorhabdus wittichii RW1]